MTKTSGNLYCDHQVRQCSHQELVRCSGSGACGRVLASPLRVVDSLRSPHRPTMAMKKAAAISPVAKPSSSKSAGHPDAPDGGNPNQRKAPKPWWEYEEDIARLAYDLKAEAADDRGWIGNSMEAY